MDKQECLKKILDFLEKEKKGKDAYYFLTFRFDELRNRDNSYGKYRAERDEDNYWLTKYINYVLYEDVLPNMSSLSEMNEFYGGDTINPVYNSEYYLTIGNFMLLPKLSYNGHTTFNTYRYSCYRDDLFLFLKKIEEIYDNIEYILDYKKTNSGYKKWLNTGNNVEWMRLVLSNQFYFNAIDTYEKFLKANFLEDFQNENIEQFVKSRSKKICDKLAENLQCHSALVSESIANRP